MEENLCRKMGRFCRQWLHKIRVCCYGIGILLGDYTLHLSEDVVRCIGAGERYVYRRNPGWTQITFTNLKRPSSKLHKVKGWFSSKGFFQLFYFGKKLQVLPESIFYYWFSTLCYCTFACYSKIFFNLNLPDFFLIKTKAAEVIFWPQG